MGIGASSVSSIVKEAPPEICSEIQDRVHFPKEERDLASVLKGFEEIAGLPYCCGGVEGSQIKWLACPDEQFYDYRCYRGYPSIVLFPVSTADRRFIYADVGRPGVLGDSTIYSMLTLKRNTEEKVWFGDDVSSLFISGV